MHILDLAVCSLALGSAIGVAVAPSWTGIVLSLVLTGLVSRIPIRAD